MLKVKFVNQTEVVYLEAVETEEYWGGSNRRTLTVECAPGAMDLTALNALLSVEAHVQKLEFINEVEAISNLYEGYLLKLDVGIKKKLTVPESAGNPAVYEDRLIFKLGKRTYIEEQLARLKLI